MSDLPEPRELAGPFLILGIDKDADAATIETRWQSQRDAIERGECQWSIDDLDWAKETLLDTKQRLNADVESLNCDLASGEVQRLLRQYHLNGSPAGWEPIDPEPPMELPEIDPTALTNDVSSPQIPVELPAINAWLTQFAAAVTDPWTMELSGN